MKVLFITLIAAALPASAQWRSFGSEAHATGFFGLGFSAPVNPLAAQLDAGWNLAGGIGVTNQYVGILLDGMFSDFGINHAALIQTGVPRGDRKYWAVTVDPIIHVNERGPVDFYITGGGGIYSQVTEYRFERGGFISSRNDLLASYSIYKPGVDGGAGFAFNLGYSPVKIFVEARFHHMFNGPEASFIPVTLGIRF